jgi:hypothetical protein
VASMAFLAVTDPPSAYGDGPWTAARRVGYGIQKATFIIREF